jgi:serine/threonine protein kinase
VGAVGFYMLTGRAPFIGESDFDITHQILHGDVPGISTLRSAPLDAVFEGLILRCLSKEREDRPGSALAMMAELDALSFLEPWSEVRAAEWWRRHLAQAELKPAAS